MSASQGIGIRVFTFGDGLFDVVIHAQRSPGVEVPPRLEGVQHGGAVRHVGQQSQLQLAVVSHDQVMPLAEVRSEGLAHLHKPCNISNTEWLADSCMANLV